MRDDTYKRPECYLLKLTLLQTTPRGDHKEVYLEWNFAGHLESITHRPQQSKDCKYLIKLLGRVNCIRNGMKYSQAVLGVDKLFKSKSIAI